MLFLVNVEFFQYKFDEFLYRMMIASNRTMNKILYEHWAYFTNWYALFRYYESCLKKLLNQAKRFKAFEFVFCYQITCIWYNMSYESTRNKYFVFTFFVVVVVLSSGNIIWIHTYWLSPSTIQISEILNNKFIFNGFSCESKYVEIVFFINKSIYGR